MECDIPQLFTILGIEAVSHPSDEILNAALNKRDDLREELRKIDDFIATYRKIRLELHIDERNTEGTRVSAGLIMRITADQMSQVEEREEATSDVGPKVRVRVRGNPRPAVVVAAAVELIRKAGQPLTRREIYNGLVSQGIVVQGADPVKAVGTTLWRATEELEQVEGRGYWLAGVPVPPPEDLHEDADLSDVIDESKGVDPDLASSDY